jgi:hypothetical protein
MMRQTGSCFDKEVLEKLIRAYNRHYPKKAIRNVEKKSFPQLWKELQKKLKAYCGKDESCWVSHLGMDNDDTVDDYVRPKTPSEWLSDPDAWLSNFDIEAVMIQYERKFKPMYDFLGVYPVDFLRKTSTHQCYYPEVCNFQLKKAYEAGTRYIGLVINLDPHDEPGSHWTSLFVCIDPRKACFGAYYYDSVTGEAPSDMKIFMKELKRQADLFKKELKVTRAFKIEENKVRHQYGHSECGVFSMYYQLRWLQQALDTKGKITFQEVVGPKITDSEVFKLRKILFRP